MTDKEFSWVVVGSTVVVLGLICWVVDCRSRLISRQTTKRTIGGPGYLETWGYCENCGKMIDRDNKSLSIRAWFHTSDGQVACKDGHDVAVLAVPDDEGGYDISRIPYEETANHE